MTGGDNTTTIGLGMQERFNGDLEKEATEVEAGRMQKCKDVDGAQ